MRLFKKSKNITYTCLCLSDYKKINQKYYKNSGFKRK